MAFKFTLADFPNLTLDGIARVLEDAVGQIVTIVDEVKEHQHNMANSGVHMKGYMLTADRLQVLNEVQGYMVKAKEVLRRL